MQTAARLDNTPLEVPRGLSNVVVTETMLSDVNGQQGFYHYRQYSAIELAKYKSVEEVWHLLLFGELPGAEQLTEFRRRIARQATLSPELIDLLALLAKPRSAASPAEAEFDVLAGLRTALAFEGSRAGLAPLYDLSREERIESLISLAAKVTGIVAALHRLHRGQQPLSAQPALSYVENYLYLLSGERPEPAHTAALSNYLVAAIDHGFNASTFTARVIASTGADAASCLVGALGSLSGPLHGGAPSRALDTLDAIGSIENIDPWITEQVLAGKRIMGFGHPVYRTEDPRSALLKQVARSFGGPRVDFAVAVEERIPVLLEQLKPGRELHTNLEWYAAIVMEICGLERSLFSPTFAAARVLGWCANVLEQSDDSKIFRPSARYIGPSAPQPLP
ncbi:citrate/2-methylcitrate synthase [Psychromicrobium lacuslunae]|uniref:Citrate synthase n=1 Tax=Psychromicrobium lacuslunae TaxID=1618207 RepID=A0A0D4C1B6_9MICC|nr:citrate/2-methylcitrate synthase [Psychromicrobium lacuslunae]AJT42185.1 citrate (Si)-synthase [Psychromicrobium lacuslunae]